MMVQRDTVPLPKPKVMTCAVATIAICDPVCFRTKTNLPVTPEILLTCGCEEVLEEFRSSYQKRLYRYIVEKDRTKYYVRSRSEVDGFGSIVSIGDYCYYLSICELFKIIPDECRKHAAERLLDSTECDQYIQLIRQEIPKKSSIIEKFLNFFRSN